MRAHALIALLLLSCCGRAHALASCTVTATPVAFGTYAPLSGAAADASGTVTVTCALVLGLSLTVNYTIQLSKGTAGSYAPRQLASGAQRLDYNLYKNSARTTVWGDGTSGTSTTTDGYLLGVGGAVRNYTVYGRVPASQTATRSGVYADTITVTVNY